jgi:hypothetical protein
MPPNSIPAVVQEYEFSTLPDAKTVLLRVRHIMQDPSGQEISFNRGECILKEFACVSGFAGDVTVTANCVQEALPGTLVNNLPRTFKVIMNSRETILIDVETEAELYKV